MALTEDAPLFAWTDNTPSENGVWQVVGNGVQFVRAIDEQRTILLVPSEDILVTTVHLPLASHHQRLAALPFAVEDMLVAPLDRQHIALGRSTAPERYLAAIVAPETMERWLALAAENGLDPDVILPDYLTLMQPWEADWSCFSLDGRTLVRQIDGTGFAIATDKLPLAWQGAGCPPCIGYGTPLPDPIAPVHPGPLPMDGWMPLLPADINLRQGRFAVRATPMSSLWRRIGLIVIAGLAAHLLIAGLDTLALRHILTGQQAETRTLLEKAHPGVAAGADLIGEAQALLPGAGGESAFLPLLSRASAALPAGIRLGRISFAEDDQALRLAVVVPDIGTMQRIETSLKAAGLNISNAGASNENGQMIGQLILRADEAHR